MKRFFLENWFKLLLLIIMIIAIQVFSLRLSKIEKEITSIGNGIRIDIVDSLNTPQGLPSLP